MSYQGDYAISSTVGFKFTTRQASGVPFTLAGVPVLSCYASGTNTPITAGITLNVDYPKTGLNDVAIVASVANGYASGTSYDVVITTGTVNGVSVVGEVVGSFSIEARSALRPATAGRTLVVDAAGLADANTVKVGPTGSGTAQTAGDIPGKTNSLTFTGAGKVDASVRDWIGGTIPAVNVTGVPLVDLKYVLGTVSPAAAGSVRADAVTGAVGSVTGNVGGNVTGSVDSVTGNVGGSVASVVAAVSITGDLSATMKTSVTTAATAATPTAAAVTGAVGSVTGNVGGNVVGSVASVTGNVGGNVTGSVGSVVGAVGSVTGAVGSVTGAVGSVTGNVGGNVVGSVASVVGLTAANLDVAVSTRSTFAGGAVASVTGSVGGNVGGNVLGSVAGNVGGNVVGSVGSVVGLTASDVAAIKAKTDSLTFSISGFLDAGIYYVNGVAVTGSGTEAHPWGPA